MLGCKVSTKATALLSRDVSHPSSCSSHLCCPSSSKSYLAAQASSLYPNLFRGVITVTSFTGVFLHVLFFSLTWITDNWMPSLLAYYLGTMTLLPPVFCSPRVARKTIQTKCMIRVHLKNQWDIHTHTPFIRSLTPIMLSNTQIFNINIGDLNKVQN